MNTQTSIRFTKLAAIVGVTAALSACIGPPPLMAARVATMPVMAASTAAANAAANYPPIVVSGPPAEALVPFAPPALPAENAGYPPAQGMFWMGGFWRWQGTTYAWVPGRWEPMRSGLQWIPHRWEQTGSGWRFTPGYWTRG